MNDFPTVTIGELAPPRASAEALTDWFGFAELAPASRTRVTMRHLVLDNAPGESWKWNQVPEYDLPPLGCGFLRDLEVSGSGYLFHAGRFVREHVNISDVALRWLRDPGFFDNPLVHIRANRVVVDEPALIVFGPGSSIYGHWLLDFMPRIVVSQRLMGAGSRDLVLPLPSDIPDWVPRMISTFCGIDPDRVRYYSHHDDQLICRQACVPSYAHCGKPGNYALHPLVREFYDLFGDPGAPRAKRRICLSRRDQERRTFGIWRIFEQRETMETMAAARGFEIMRPEVLSFSEQVELFRSANCILGEQGSGMHAAVFADPGTIVATVGPGNRHQLHIANAFEQRSISMNRHQVLERPEKGPFRYAVAEADLASLFDRIDAVEAGDPADFRSVSPTRPQDRP